MQEGQRQDGGLETPTTIALVDDDRNILTSVAIALENEGYRVRSYTDGASALEALGNHPADLALLDIKMPRLDGLETLKRLRQTLTLRIPCSTAKRLLLPEPSAV